MKLSIIIPVYNEEKTLHSIVDRIQAVQYPIDYEIIVVDDASTDRTSEEVYLLKMKNREAKGIRIFRNRINNGKGFSIRKGIRRAKGDIIIIQDADMEYDPQDIPKLIEPIINGESDVVYGSRFLLKRHPEGMIFKNWFANKVLKNITNVLYELNITDLCTCYKVFRSEVIKNLALKANRFTFCPEVTALLAKSKIKIKELPIAYKGRNIKDGKKIKARDFFAFVFILLLYRFKRIPSFHS
jgi:glycosyltransferase involved in cell wall biosynthesis